MKTIWLGLEQSVGRDDVLCMNKNTFNLENVSEFQPDIVIEREFNAGGMSWEKEIPLIKDAIPNVKTAVWLIDTHVREDFHRDYCKLFDYAFFAISSFLPSIDHPNKFWLPVCFPSVLEAMPEPNVVRPHEFGFIGSHGTPYLEQRTEFYRLIKDIYPDFHIKRDFSTVYSSMAEIKYMVNLSYNGDMNFRTFESLACGCGLITSDVPDLYKIDGLVERISIFKSFTECVDQIREHHNVGVTSQVEWVKEGHMLTNRLGAIEKMVETGIQETF